MMPDDSVLSFCQADEAHLGRFRKKIRQQPTELETQVLIKKQLHAA